jgi:hypothetical protein
MALKRSRCNPGGHQPYFTAGRSTRQTESRGRRHLGVEEHGLRREECSGSFGDDDAHVPVSDDGEAHELPGRADRILDAESEIVDILLLCENVALTDDLDGRLSHRLRCRRAS